MVDSYYAVATGTDLANLTNIESLVSQPAHALDNGLVPLQGLTARRTLSGLLVRNGAINGVLRFSFAKRDNLNSFTYSIWDDFTTASKSCVMSALDETGNYSPFTC